MLLSGWPLLGRVALLFLHSVEKLICIRSSASHPYKSGIEFTICLFSLGGTLLRRSLPVNTVLGKKVGTDMDGVVNIVGEMCNLPQFLQLLVQFIEIRHGRSFTDTLEDILYGSSALHPPQVHRVSLPQLFSAYRLQDPYLPTDDTGGNPP